jgi:tetraacyldisaccharide 4'-kinase
MIRTPTHWAKRGWPAVLLLPLSGLWAVAAWLRKVTARTRRAALPVICVGNLGAGGTGKTPIVSWLYDNLASRGWNPVILSRGYGGKLDGPAWVDGSSHDAAAIGDEPLMMAESRDVMVSRDRVAGARAIEAHGAHDVIIMDDGLQNPYLEKQLRIGVFDGGFGAGNGWLIPAGPLRTGWRAGLAMMDMVIINGTDATGLTARIGGRLPVHHVATQIDQEVVDSLADTPLLAFAGIGRPARMFESLEAAGGQIAKRLSFADHHPYSGHDLTRLQEEAHQHGAAMITTHKDWVRLPAEWRDRVTMLPISIQPDDADALVDGIERSLRRNLNEARHG